MTSSIWFSMDELDKLLVPMVSKETFIRKWLQDRAKLISEAKMAVNWERLAAREYNKEYGNGGK